MEGLLGGAFEKLHSDYTAALEVDKKTREKEREELDQAKKQLEEEIKVMTAVEISDDDVLNINVGGEFISVKRSTLTLVKGSHLSAMFSGRWEDKIAYDSNGCIFLDFDPFAFKECVAFLRRMVLVKEATQPSYPLIPAEKAPIFESLVAHLGLSDAFGMTKSRAFNVHANGSVMLTNNSTVAVATLTEGYRYAIVNEPVSSPSVTYWKLCPIGKVETMYLGIIGSCSPGPNSQEHATSFCWGGKGNVCSKGKRYLVPDWEGFTSGEDVLFRLDLVKGQLSMKLRGSRQMRRFNNHAVEPLSCPYFIHVNLGPHSGNSVDFKTVTQEDIQLFC